MIVQLGLRLSHWSKRIVPDPFVLAIGLTLVTFCIALPRMAYDPMTTLQLWVHGSGQDKGLWNLLAFAMQMSLILITGYALAEAPLVRRVIERLAKIPSSTRSAVVVVSLTAMFFAFFNWGLGLIVGALIAKAVGQAFRADGRPLHYPIVCASGYTGLAVWHGGFSGSAPLKATSATQLTEILGPDLGEKIQPMLLDSTLGSSLNLTVTALCLIGFPLVLLLLSPSAEQDMDAAPDLTPAPPKESATDSTSHGLAHHLEHAFWVVCIPSLMGLFWCANWLADVGISKLSPNVINLFMLSLGLLLHGSAKSYVAAVQTAVGSCAGIILQYPFYAGIMGIMAGSGVITDLGALMSGLSADALAITTFYSGGLVNLFVPSGGGQWAVQGPVVMEAALQAKASPNLILMALCYGDQWTNLIQPFWALPLLGICQIRVSAMIGYTALLLIITQFFFLIPLIIFI